MGRPDARQEQVQAFAPAMGRRPGWSAGTASAGGELGQVAQGAPRAAEERTICLVESAATTRRPDSRQRSRAPASAPPQVAQALAPRIPRSREWSARTSESQRLAQPQAHRPGQRTSTRGPVRGAFAISTGEAGWAVALHRVSPSHRSWVPRTPRRLCRSRRPPRGRWQADGRTGRKRAGSWTMAASYPQERRVRFRLNARGCILGALARAAGSG
jgi:hypothetical protein